MGNVESGLERLKWDKQTTFCSLWEHGMCIGDISQAGRKLSPAALEQCSSSPGATLQRLRNVSPKPLEKVYSPLRKSCERRNAVRARPLRRQSCSPGKSCCSAKGGERVGMWLSAACRKSGICGKQKPFSPLKVGKSRFSLPAGEFLGRIVGETVSLEPCFSSETNDFQCAFFCTILLQKAVGRVLGPCPSPLATDEASFLKVNK